MNEEYSQIFSNIKKKQIDIDKHIKKTEYKQDSNKIICSNNSFSTNVSGVTKENRQQIIKNLYEGQVLNLKRQYNNNYDECAVAVIYEKQQIGYIPIRLSSMIAQFIDKGTEYCCNVNKVIGGDDGKYYGVIIEIKFSNKEEIENSIDVVDYIDNYYYGLDEDERQDYNDWLEYVDNHY